MQANHQRIFLSVFGMDWGQPAVVQFAVTRGLEWIMRRQFRSRRSRAPGPPFTRAKTNVPPHAPANAGKISVLCDGAEGGAPTRELRHVADVIEAPAREKRTGTRG